MATAIKKPTPVPPPSSSRKNSLAKPSDPWPLRALDATYRFLASLKLAVVSISMLALTLAYATFHESWKGAGAVQHDIYRSPGFAILLAFLGANILCAALIRFPWTKRQTGFVITHAGLLIVLLGAFLSSRAADEGQVGAGEGEVMDELVRTDHQVIRVEKIDPHTGQAIAGTQAVYPFYPGPHRWREDRVERITGPKEPIQIEVRNHLPASGFAGMKHEPAPDGRGQPMLKAALMVKPPNAPQPFDALARQDEGWITVENPRIGREVRDVFPVQFAFQYVSGPRAAEKVDDFLHPPKQALRDRLARFHYQDKAGKDRVYEWVLQEDQAARPGPGETVTPGHTIVLPDSDLSVSFVQVMPLPTSGPELSSLLDVMGESMVRLLGLLGQATGDPVLRAAVFKVRKADGPEVTQIGWGSLPMVPGLLSAASGEGSGEGLVRIGYFHPPEISQQALQGRMAVIEVMGTDDGRLFYRAIGRDGQAKVGPLPLDAPVPLFGGEAQAMSVTLQADQYLTSGRAGEIYEPVMLPKDKRDQGLPAGEFTMTVDGHTERFWALRSVDLLKPLWKTVSFPTGTYRVSYDFDRRPLGFGLKLTDFEFGRDPGTQQPSSYTSQVLLNDSEKGVVDRPITITMNRPLSYRGLTFYQANVDKVKDPHTGRPSGRFLSILSVHYDPFWPVVYTGCALVVLGIFVQFYMRAGVFTDGGKKQRERDAAKARKAARRRGETVAEAPAPADEPEDEPL